MSKRNTNKSRLTPRTRVRLPPNTAKPTPDSEYVIILNGVNAILPDFDPPVHRDLVPKGRFDSFDRSLRRAGLQVENLDAVAPQLLSWDPTGGHLESRLVAAFSPMAPATTTAQALTVTTAISIPTTSVSSSAPTTTSTIGQ